MKLSELMKDYTPSESYEGWVTNDDYVFAIDTAPNGSTARLISLVQSHTRLT